MEGILHLYVGVKHSQNFCNVVGGHLTTHKVACLLYSALIQRASRFFHNALHTIKHAWSSIQMFPLNGWVYISPKPQNRALPRGGGHLFGNTPLLNCYPIHFIISLPLLRSRHKIPPTNIHGYNVRSKYTRNFPWVPYIWVQRHKFIVCLLNQRKEKPSRKICRGEVYRRKIQNWFLQLVSNQNQNLLRTDPKSGSWFYLCVESEPRANQGLIGS